MNLDPLQRVVLAELGLVAYRRAVVGPAAGLPQELLGQLARAAGLSADRLLEHPQLLAQATRMGRDPRARRALWTQLRALRKGA